MTKRLLTVLALIIPFSLGGCASTVGWGKRYEVVHSNTKSITIHYDPLLATIADVSKKADEHCRRFGREAVPRTADSGSYWAPTKNIVFYCE